MSRAHLRCPCATPRSYSGGMSRFVTCVTRPPEKGGPCHSSRETRNVLIKPH